MPHVFSSSAALPEIIRAPGRRIRALLTALTALALLGPASAQATTVRLGDGGGPVETDFAGWEILYLQNGFTWQGSISYCCLGEFAYLHDDSGISTSVFSSVDGHRFDALDFDAGAYSKVYRAADTPPPLHIGSPDFDYDVHDPVAIYRWAMDSRPVFNTIGWYGFRDGVEVARVELSDYAPARAFGEDFSDLDSLVLRQLFPETDLLTHWVDDPRITPGAVWCYEWCGGVKFFGLTLEVHDGAPVAPVPLPATGLLLLSGLAALGLRRRGMGRRLGRP